MTTIIPGTHASNLIRQDFHQQIALNRLTGYDNVQKFGRNSDIDTAAAEDIWLVGGVAPTYTAAIEVAIISSDTNDTAAGTGAQAVLIEYVNDSYDFASATIETNGTSESTQTIDDLIHLNRARVTRVGTFGGSNIGTLTIRISSGGASVAQIAAGFGRTERTHFLIARNYEATLDNLYVSVDSAKTTSATLFVQTNYNDVTTPFSGAKQVLYGFTGLSGFASEDFHKSPPTITETPARIWWEADVGSNNTEVRAGYGLTLYNIAS